MGIHDGAGNGDKFRFIPQDTSPLGLGFRPARLGPAGEMRAHGATPEEGPAVYAQECDPGWCGHIGATVCWRKAGELLEAPANWPAWDISLAPWRFRADFAE
jgi:hypothetical protein